MDIWSMCYASDVGYGEPVEPELADGLYSPRGMGERYQGVAGGLCCRAASFWLCGWCSGGVRVACVQRAWWIYGRGGIVRTYPANCRKDDEKGGRTMTAKNHFLRLLAST